MTKDLMGRTALITGAGNGLGKAVAISLDRAGMRTILIGRNEQKLVGVAQTLGDCRYELCDVTDPAAVDDLAERLADESINVLINNAGVGGPVAPLHEIEPREWDDVFSVNVRGLFLMCRAFIPPMIDAGEGHIINLASVTGKRPLLNRAPYAASKMAVLGLTTTLALELAPHGILVNSLSPGPVRGERMTRNFRMAAERAGSSPEAEEQAFASRAAMGRLVEESEVGDAVLAMLAMTALTGADIDLSAGMFAR